MVPTLSQEPDWSSTTGKTRRRARAYQRVAVRCGCWLEHDLATVYGTTIDLGQGGLFLRTALPMTPGVPVRVTLEIPGHSPVVAEGCVIHRVAPPDGERPGLGVRFERLVRGDRSLSEFLSGSVLESERKTLDLPSQPLHDAG